ncbi:MAG: hypothetical protein Q8M91_06335 [Polaromonas sp.]|nr:hypothetical protein [Polaromonas sp.]MDP3169943.1 hypothetical protein [Polaromonas sp.]MDP3412384.1 hypothetical protein [Polaromonas sp.]MDP3605603.1 hypothetical protein [Polaromonas sp.]
MKLNQSLTAAITAAALVAGAGFAYAQTSAPQVTNTPGNSSAQGPLNANQSTSGAAGSGSMNNNSGSMNSNSTMQSQPSTGSGTTSMDNSATTSADSTLEPRADRN